MLMIARIWPQLTKWVVTETPNVQRLSNENALDVIL